MKWTRFISCDGIPSVNSLIADQIWPMRHFQAYGRPGKRQVQVCGRPRFEAEPGVRQAQVCGRTRCEAGPGLILEQVSGWPMFEAGPGMRQAQV